MSHRHSTKTIHNPIAISERKRTWYAVEWLVKGSDNRPGKTLEERLAREMIAVAQRDPNSTALRKKEELHKMAMINRYVSSLFVSNPASIYIFVGATFPNGATSSALYVESLTYISRAPRHCPLYLISTLTFPLV